MGKSLMASVLVALFLAGCTTLPPKDEFLALPEQEKWSMMYEYVKENRTLAVGGAVIGAAGIGLGIANVVGVAQIGKSIQATAP